MFKPRFLSLAAILGSLLFASCGGDSDDSPPTSGEVTSTQGDSDAEPAEEDAGPGAEDAGSGEEDAEPGEEDAGSGDGEPTPTTPGEVALLFPLDGDNPDPRTSFPRPHPSRVLPRGLTGVVQHRPPVTTPSALFDR